MTSDEVFGNPSSIQFSKEENQFLMSKIGLLDRNSTSSIQIGTALQILNYTGLKSYDKQKIIKNLKLQGKKLLSYDEMKKIFRGVSLVQKGHQPSLININANIKLKMPKFYDDDQQQEQSTTPPQPQPEKKIEVPQKQNLITPPNIQRPSTPIVTGFQNPTNHKATVNQVPKNIAFDNFQQFTQVFDKKPQPKVQIPNKPVNNHMPQKIAPPPIQKLHPQQNVVSKKFAGFEANWSKLKTHNNRIDGAQVKNLCKNLAQKNLLSKAWKLCCISQPGTLSKGQFFVFLQIIESKKQMPELLTQEMKRIILQIDKTSPSYPTRQKQPDRQKMMKTSINLQNSTNIGLSASQTFQNFGKPPATSASIKATTPPVQQFQPKFDSFLQVSTKMAQKFVSANKQIHKSHQNNEQQVMQLRRQQQVMNNMMCQVDQFVNLVNTKNNAVRTQIDELKSNQKRLNDRLNNVCVSMNQIIVKQNSFIQELLGQINQQNQYNQERISVLEDHVRKNQLYSNQMENNYRQTDKSITNNQQGTSKINKNYRAEHNIEKQQNNKPVVSQYNKSTPHSVKKYQQNQSDRQTQQVNYDNVHQAKQVNQNYNRDQQNENVSPHQKSPDNHISQIKSPGTANAEEQPQSQEEIQHKNKIQIIIMQVIQLINYFNPIPTDKYPQLIQTLKSMPEQTLYIYHSKFVEKYQQEMQNKRIQQERMQQSKIKQSEYQEQRPNTHEDQFSSSNFNVAQKNGIQEAQENFFNQ